MNRLKQLSAYTLGAILLLLPFALYAADTTLGGQLVPCDGPSCSFKDFVQLIQNIINFLIAVSVPLAAGLFSYAGWLYVTAGGNAGKLGKATSIFTNVGIGLGIILGAWLVVYTVASALFKSDSQALYFLQK